MKLPEISHKLRKIAALDMAAQSYQTLILDLAVELDLEEARLSKERARKLHGPSKDNPRNLRGDVAESPASRVIDITLPSFTSQESKKEEPPISPPSKPLFVEPKGFSEFWEIYPRRSGGNDRLPAARGFLAAVRRAGGIEVILAGAKRYRAFCDAKGNTGGDYVLKARKWLNAQAWNETYEINQYRPKSGSIAGSAAIIDAALAAEETAIREEEERQRFGETHVDELPRLRQVN